MVHDMGPAATPGDDEAFLLKGGVGAGDCARGAAQALGEGAHGWEGLPRGEAARRNRCAKLARHLGVERLSGAGIDGEI